MLRKVLTCGLFLALSSLTASANDYLIPIAGSVGAFRTDVRILNPSPTTDLTITAFFLPIGNQANALTDGKTLTIPRMQMAVYNDAVSTIFSATGIGAIILALPGSDQMLVTARIYADTPSGTLGQGFVCPSVTNSVMTNGALIQLRANSAFRTNIGAINPQNDNVDVTWTLYDKNNVMVSQKTIHMAPYAVIGPTSITSGFFFDAGTADLTDAWVTFTTTGIISAYASIIDNLSTDPTFLPAQPLQ